MLNTLELNVGSEGEAVRSVGVEQQRVRAVELSALAEQHRYRDRDPIPGRRHEPLDLVAVRVVAAGNLLPLLQFRFRVARS
jgi:hypothetical protein